MDWEPPLEATTVTLNILLYGPPKKGKTMGACSAPGELVLLNADQPNATLYARAIYGERIHVPKFTRGILGTMDDIVGEVEENPGKIQSVVVDPIGELHRLLLEEMSKRRVRPTLDQYGDATTHLERWCRKMCELPVNFVIVAHEHTVNEGYYPYTGTRNLTLGQKLMGMVDLIGYCGIARNADGAEEYLAQLFAAEGREGGSRFKWAAEALGGTAPVDIAAWTAAIAGAIPRAGKMQDQPTAEEAVTA